MQIHNLIQGSNDWNQFRLAHFGASEAAAMLGLSKKVKRSELLHMKHTGNAKEFSDWVQKNILDYGHEVEAMQRPHIEAQIGEDLYPVTCSEGRLSASCDGLTMGEDVAFEHKQWNEELAASVRAGVLPEEHMPQCQQILMVTGAKKVIFVVSDGTPERREQMDVLPNPAWFDRIRAGWRQFEKDLAEYVPPVDAPEAVGRTPESLPALRIEVAGMVTSSNLAQYKEHALAVFKGIKRDLQTDQDFADADKTVKWCKDIEERLSAAKQHALSQTESIDALFRAIDEISAEARATRLELDRLVDARKKQIRLDIQQEGVNKLAEHITALNARLGKPYMPAIGADFAGAMKGKKTVSSLRDAVDTELARAKIAANEVADRIQANLNTIDALASEHAFLFVDAAQIVLKPADDLVSLVKLRIQEYKETEDKRLAEITDAEEKEKQAPASEPIALPATTITGTFAGRSAPTLRLGQIGERLGFALTADFLASLGFPPAATDKSAKLYHEADFPRICAALVNHISQVQQRLAA